MATVPTLREIAKAAERKLAPAVKAEQKIGRAERYQAEWAAACLVGGLDRRTRRMVAETAPHVAGHRGGSFTAYVAACVGVSRPWTRRRLSRLADLGLVEEFGPRGERWRLTVLGREVVRVLDATAAA